MKKIILFLILFNISFANSIVTSYDEALLKNELNNFFKAIRTNNNKYAISFIEEKSDKINNVDEKYTTDIQTKEIEIKKININEKDDLGYNALLVAIEASNNEMVKLLLSKNADHNINHPVLGRGILHVAVYYQNVEAVKMILDKYPEKVNEKSNNDGWLPLEDAVLKGNKEIINILLIHKADPMMKDNNGHTALDLAINIHKGEIVKILRDYVKSERK